MQITLLNKALDNEQSFSQGMEESMRKPGKIKLMKEFS